MARAWRTFRPAAARAADSPIALRSWVDSLTMALAPRWTLQRQRARISAELLKRHYEAASTGRRTQGWTRSGADPNAVVGQAAANLRTSSRDAVRNDSYAEGALKSIVNNTVGWGIVGNPLKTWGTAQQRERARLLWNAWAGSTQCDADGRLNFYGIQKMCMRAVGEGGEVLVRRRIRRPEDGLVIPLQLQVIEPEFIDSSKDRILNENGRRQVQGVEFDAIGRRAGYWLFKDHPGSAVNRGLSSTFVPAEEIIHVFSPLRPGQTRGIPWLASVLLRLRDFDDYEDATLMKQKIAACLAVITTDVDGSNPALGESGENASGGLDIDYLEPGMIANIAPGRAIETVSPPTNADHESYSKTVLRGVATGLGLSYEELTGDFSEVNFSSARMARLKMWANVHDWRWNMLIPQLCDGVWAWAMQLAAVVDAQVMPDTPATWTPPPMPMIEPDREGLAYQRNIRTGIQTLSEAQRERGFDPDEMTDEMKEDLARLDKAGILLDVDVRNVSQSGVLQVKALADSQPKSPAPAPPSGGAPPADDAKDGEDASQALAGLLYRALDIIGRRDETKAQPITVQANTTVERGAIAPVIHAGTTIEPPMPPPQPNVTVHAGTTIEAGAIAPPPPPNVAVDARTTIEAPPPAPAPQVSVSAPVTIAEGAIKLEAPIDASTIVEAAAPTPAPQVVVTQPPPPPTVTVIPVRRRKKRTHPSKGKERHDGE